MEQPHTDSLPSDQPGDPLEAFRGYLRVLADLHMDRRLRGKLDASDIVQQTMLRAHLAFPELRDKRPEVLTAWLRKILASTLADTVKHYRRDRRHVDMEKSIAGDLDRSASGLQGWAAPDQTSPSMAASRNEELLRLVAALEQLPDEMREVVVLKHLRSLTLKEISAQTGKSTASIASLLRRGLAKLRGEMT